MSLIVRNRNNHLESDLDRILTGFFAPSYIREELIKPPVEISEKDGNYILRAQLPGLKKENIDVEISENYLTISGEYRDEKEERGEKSHKSEFRYEKFLRKIEFAEKIDNKKAEARYEDGILTLILPKSDEDKDKVIKLKL